MMHWGRMQEQLKQGKTLLYLAATALLVLMAIAAFASPSGAWPLSAAAIVCIFLANTDKFSEISASTSGVSATIREAKSKIAELQDLVEVMSEAQIYSLQSAGRWGSAHDDKEYYFNRIISTMKESGLSDATIRDIREKNWDRYIRFDYITSILGGSTIPHPVEPEYNSIREEWKKLRDFCNQPTPEQLRAFLLKIGEEDPKKLALLDAFQKYCETLEHPNMEIWKSRKEVKHITIKSTAVASP